MKINHPDWYPSYLNPSFDEIIELAKSRWDTCRILWNADNGDFIIASGYGNTHDSIQSRYYIHLGAEPIEREINGILRKRWKTNGVKLAIMHTCILHHSDGIAMMNLEDVGGSQYARYEKWPLSDKHLEVIKDLIRESGLAL